MSNNHPNKTAEEDRTANFYITESYKTIRTNLQFSLAAAEDKKVTAITSYEPNAGKSITTANMAITMAQTGAHVLLIDGDMRNASQHKIFGVTNTNGLSKLLSGLSRPDDTSFFRGVRPNLDLLPAGPTPPNPSELLCSKNMKKLLDALREAYDFIFVDCPPVGVISDTLSLLSNAPNVLIVVRQRQTRHDDIKRSIEKIRAVGGMLLGVVITDVSDSDSPFGGRYGRYGKYGKYGKYGRYGKGDKYSAYTKSGEIHYISNAPSNTQSEVK